MSPLGKRQREPGIARLQAVGGCQEHASEYVWLMRQEDDYRRDRHVVSALTVHLVSVSVCADFDAELVEMDGHDDHVHVMVSYPPNLPSRGS